MKTIPNVRGFLLISLSTGAFACGGDPVEPAEEPVAASIEILPDSIRALRFPGDTVTLQAVVRDQNGEIMEELPAPGILWYTEQPEAVKVYLVSGRLEARRKGGEATVFAQVGDVKESVSVVVWPSLSGGYEGLFMMTSNSSVNLIWCRGDASLSLAVDDTTFVGSFSVGPNTSPPPDPATRYSGCREGNLPAHGKFEGVRISAESVEIIRFTEVSGISDDRFRSLLDSPWPGSFREGTLTVGLTRQGGPNQNWGADFSMTAR